MTAPEDKITGWFREQSNLNTAKFPIGIGDDMAQICLDTTSVLITTDMLLDGVHFNLAQCGYKAVGRKSMAVNLSDCAAMATKPIAAVASVGLPPGTTKNDIRQLHNGLVEVGDRYNCKLIGGDITSWKNDGKLVVNICAISEPVGKPVKRDGAKPDDIICVTGRLGGSIKGKHMNFDPRVDEAIKIASLVKLNSMMDISDGLSCDLPRICQQSNVGAIINASDIPISPAASHSDRDPLNAALNDGEDFELLFTLSPTQWSKLKQSWNDKLPITPIGQIDQKPGVRINFGQGKIEKLKPAGYDHLENER